MDDEIFFFRWNQLDVVIVFLSVLGIVLEEMKSDLMPINPTIMRVMRVLRIARGSFFQCSNFFPDILLYKKNPIDYFSIEIVENGKRYSSPS